MASRKSSESVVPRRGATRMPGRLGVEVESALAEGVAWALRGGRRGLIRREHSSAAHIGVPRARATEVARAAAVRTALEVLRGRSRPDRGHAATIITGQRVGARERRNATVGIV